MNIPIDATVQCKDGPGGRSTHVIVNPITEKVTHLVVKEKRHPGAERLVPIQLAKVTVPERIDLICTQAELAELKAFVETEFIRIHPLVWDHESVSHYGDDEVLSLPYTRMELPPEDYEGGLMLLKQKIKAIPSGELAISRGASVKATDGRVGKVDEFVVDPQSGHITHLTMRKGHFWDEGEVTIPVSEIARIQENVVYLRLTKRQIEALPEIRVRRKWR
jgi:sporulation protein YlmC with PRC-barrel domain